MHVRKNKLMPDRRRVGGRVVATLVIIVGEFIAQGHLQAADVVNIQIQPVVVKHISPDFIGFGYETSAVAQSNYFSGKNRTLINLYRTLSDRGLIRIGGLASDHTQYIADGTAVARSFHETTVINRQNLADLGDFARATGWNVMWGLNLGTGTKEQAVEEAIAVNTALAGHLESFQIGNEVEDLKRFAGSYDAYHAAYLGYKQAIRQFLPHARFSGPDSVGRLDWITKFARPEAGDLALLTYHYYCSDAHDPQASIEKLLAGDDRFAARLADLQALSVRSGPRYRINEVNSFSGGGKPGVSDTFASALWCLDYMFLLATHDCDGLNLQTDFNHLAWLSHYSPIVHDQTGQCTARPEYYGMLAFSLAGKGDMVKLKLEKPDIHCTAYATKNASGDIWLTAVNKDLSEDADVRAILPAGCRSAETFRLTAPSLESKDQVTLAGAKVSAEGSWSAATLEKISPIGDTLSFPLPHASAEIVRLRR
jgi:hypothetical protein